MKLLTCASYYGTGSSAVTDLVSECDNVHFLGDYEFRFVQDPDGICDLEYNLVLNNHRHNSGYALKRYERNVKFLNGNRLIKKYNKFFGNNWIELSEQYVKDLTDLEYLGYWHQDVRDKGEVVYVLERLINKVMHSLPFVDDERNYTLFMNHFTNYAAFPGDRFYEITRKYINDLFETVNTDHKDFVMVDQLVPPSNTSHYLNYFDDIRVVCVDRDPRDLYILESECWRGTIVPRDVYAYCKWYAVTRKHRMYEKDDKERILRIRFEDLIYHYNEMVADILSFCRIDSTHHVFPKTKLIPEESIRNTKLLDRFPQYAAEVKIIEKELADFLYDFNDV